MQVMSGETQAKNMERLDFPVLDDFVPLQCTSSSPALVFGSSLAINFIIKKFVGLHISYHADIIQLFIFSFCSTDTNTRTNSIFFINIVNSYLDVIKIYVDVLHHGIKVKILNSL